jgi:outer membrane cobalamin receptor
MLIWIAGLSLHAQNRNKGGITGMVTDRETGETLYGANILVKGTVLGAASGADGRFSIPFLKPGVYQLEVTMMGYKKEIMVHVEVRPDEETHVDFLLEPTVLIQPTLIVTASKRKQAIEDAPTTVDVMSSEDIQSRNVTTLDQALENTSGLSIINDQVSLRGSTGWNLAAGSRVLLMVDGHPLISGDTGGINWDAVPIEEIDHVEIVKGAGSALYGSNAMAGMINVITRDPSRRPETRYKLSWGFYDEPAYSSWRWTDRFLTYRIGDLNNWNPVHSLSFEGVDLSHSRQFGNVGMLVAIGRKRSSGYMQNDDFSRWNVMSKWKIRFSPNKTLMVTGNWAMSDHGKFFEWESQETPMLVKSGKLGDRVYSEKTNFNATYEHGVSQQFAYSIKANGYRYYWQNRFNDDDSTYAKTDRIGTELQGYYLAGRHTLTFGSEVVYHHARSILYGNQSTMDGAVYIEDAFKPVELLTMTLGSRFDYHRVTGISSDQQLSPRAGLVYRPWRGTSMRLSAGHGFRAPSIAEIFAEYIYSGIRIESNPGLKDAESAWSFEWGISQAFGLSHLKNRSLSSLGRWFIETLNPNFLFDVALFWSEYTNMIDVVPDLKNSTARFENLGRARIRGVETRVKGSVLDGRLSASFGYTYTDPIDLDSQKTLTYRSRHQIVTGVEIQWWKLSMGMDYRYASRIEEIFPVLDSGYDERVPMYVVDGRITLNLKVLQISLDGKNLLNYHYTLRQRYLEPIRNFRITVKGRL